jgi:hypothetical protein
MEHNGFRFDLFDVIKTGLKWKKYILGFAVIVAIITAIVFFLKKNVYKAYGSFFPSSAVMSGRINLFRETEQEWIDMIGGENEVDRTFVIANSANVISYLIDKYDMAQHYQIDTNAPKAAQKIYKRFTKNYIVSRTGYKHLEITFTDEDHELAHQIVNEAINRTEFLIRKLYANINKQLAVAIKTRKDSLDQELNTYTDSLIQCRVRYGIYDLIGPGRKNNGSFVPKGSGLAYAEGLEVIQNIEEMKDRLAIDRARYHTLANEFKTGTFEGFPMLHVVQWATPNGPKAGPFRTIGVITAFSLALVFGLIVAVLIEIMKVNKDRIKP